MTNNVDLMVSIWWTEMKKRTEPKGNIILNDKNLWFWGTYASETSVSSIDKNQNNEGERGIEIH